MSIVKKQTIKNVATRTQSLFVYPKLVLALFILTLGLLIARIYFSNQLAISGARVSYYQNRIEDLREEQADLENSLSQKSSLGYIESKAPELGLQKTTTVEVVLPAAPVALGQ